MEIRLVPDPDATEGDAVLEAVARAVASAEVDLDPQADAYRSGWRRAGLLEGVEREPPREP